LLELGLERLAQGCGAIGWRYSDPAFTGLYTRVKGDVKAKLVNEKAKAAILVANEDVDAVKAQVGESRCGDAAEPMRGL